MAEERTEAGRNGSRGALAAFGALALVASVAGAAWWFGFVPDRTLVQPRLEEPAVGALLPLDSFIANLDDEDGRRYLMATLQLEFLGARVPDELNALVPPILRLMLTLLASELF